jgi:branched-chain amino acid transport system substrate-binding protein
LNTTAQRVKYAILIYRTVQKSALVLSDRCITILIKPWATVCSKARPLTVDEANAAGGYEGKPFKLMLHNDSTIWGAASNEIVKMVYDEQVWAMFGSLSGDTTHIALRVTLKAETPLDNSASTDPSIPETGIRWYFTDLQDDRVQGYTLAQHIYTDLCLKRTAILRVNDRWAFGGAQIWKLRDASRRLGHSVVIEQKFMPGDTDTAITCG